MATVDRLLDLWRAEGFSVTTIGTDLEPTNYLLEWGLYLITSGNTYYYDYGRHGVIRALYYKNTRELVKDELFNASVRAGENLYNIPIKGEI